MKEEIEYKMMEGSCILLRNPMRTEGLMLPQLIEETKEDKIRWKKKLRKSIYNRIILNTIRLFVCLIDLALTGLFTYIIYHFIPCNSLGYLMGALGGLGFAMSWIWNYGIETDPYLIHIK